PRAAGRPLRRGPGRGRGPGAAAPGRGPDQRPPPLCGPHPPARGPAPRPPPCRPAGGGGAVPPPAPLHLQPAGRPLGYARGDLPVTEAWADECLSLPLYPELTEAQPDRVVEGGG